MTKEPKVIQISITTEENQYLSFKSYQKIVDSLAEAENFDMVLIAGKGDPVSHPEFDRMIRYLSARIPPRRLAPAITKPLRSFAEFYQKILMDLEGVSVGLKAPVSENYYRHFELIQEVFGFQNLQGEIDQELRPRQIALCSMKCREKLPTEGIFEVEISPEESATLQFEDWLLVWNEEKPYKADVLAQFRKLILNPGCLYYSTDSSFWLLNKNAAALSGREKIPMDLHELQRLYTRGKCVSFGHSAYLTLKPKTSFPKRQEQKIRYSFLMPVYNCEESVGVCIDSILAQTVPDFELICCDDGSTDGSLKVLREYERRDSRIKVLVHAANQNAGIARFNLIDAAEGEYCAFVDSDDSVAPDFLEQANHVLMTEERYDIVEFPYKKVDKSGKALPAPAEKERLERGRDIFNLFLYTKCEPWTLWSKVIRTSILRAIPQRRVRLRYFNDCPVAVPLYYFAQSFRFYHPGHPLYFYNFGAGGWGQTMSLQKVRKKALCSRKVLEIIIQFMRFYGMPYAEQKKLILGRCSGSFMTKFNIPRFVKPEEQEEALKIWNDALDDFYAAFK